MNDIRVQKMPLFVLEVLFSSTEHCIKENKIAFLFFMQNANVVEHSSGFFIRLIKLGFLVIVQHSKKTLPTQK